MELIGTSLCRKPLLPPKPSVDRAALLKALRTINVAEAGILAVVTATAKAVNAKFNFGVFMISFPLSR